MSKRFSHSGDIGDLLAALPVIKQLGGGELVLFPAPYTGFRMTTERVENLRQFLELQPYITGVRWATGPEGTNLDVWREPCEGHKNLNLSDMIAMTLGQPYPDREQPWLKIDRPNRIAPVIFGRSHRYRNHQVEWDQIYREYARQAVFVGTSEEHYDFERAVGPINYYSSPTYLDLARVVSGADLVVANQTSIRWLAEGYKIPVLVEVDPAIDNTYWQRTAAYYLYGRSDIPRMADISEIAIQSVIQRGRDRTLLTDSRLKHIAQIVRSIRHLPGELAELGVYRGGSASVIAACCPEKRLQLFDTWDRAPENDLVGGGNDKGNFAASLDEVKLFLQLYNVEYLEGVFPETAAMLIEDETRYAFVHLDADTYQGTKAGLEYFLPRLVPGGVCVIGDEWERCPGVRLALHENRPH